VATIERKKDGYTALLKATNGQQFNAVISWVNLTNTGEYQELHIGDNVTVNGDSTHLGDVVSMKVKKIKK